MTEPFLVSIQEREDGTFVVTDALSRTHHAADPASLGIILAGLARDSELPRMEVERRNDLVGLVAGVVRRVAPEHRELVDAAEPAAHQVDKIIGAVQRFRRRRRPSSVRGER